MHNGVPHYVGQPFQLRNPAALAAGGIWAIQDVPLDELFLLGQTHGDVIYRDSTLWARLGAGTSGQFLQTQGVGADPQWAPVSALTIASQAQGDILYFDGSNWVRLAAGTSGFFLKTQGAGANPLWAAVPTPTVAVKATNETVNNSDTMQNDDALVVAVAASTTYAFWGLIIYETGATPDIKVGFTVPTGALLNWNGLGGLVSTSATISDVDSAAASEVFPGGATKGVIHFSGAIAVDSTAGNLQIQWAQNTADVSDTIVYRHSFLAVAVD